MREILFRVYDDLSKKYIDNNSVYVLGALVNGKLMFTTKNEILKHHHIEQFTGLQDKNGTKVFEGDNIKLDRQYQLSSDLICEEGIVMWCNEKSMYVVVQKHNMNDISRYHKELKNFPIYNYEVIGNIHEEENNGTTNE